MMRPQHGRGGFVRTDISRGLTEQDKQKFFMDGILRDLDQIDFKFAWAV